MTIQYETGFVKFSFGHRVLVLIQFEFSPNLLSKLPPVLCLVWKHCLVHPSLWRLKGWIAINKDILYSVLILKTSWFQEFDYQNYDGSYVWFTSYAAQLVWPNLPWFGLNWLCCLDDEFHTVTTTTLKIQFVRSGWFMDYNLIPKTGYPLPSFSGRRPFKQNKQNSKALSIHVQPMCLKHGVRVV